MKRITLSLLLGLLAAACPTVFAMNNQDVLKMQKAGLSEETILAAMQKESADYDTGIDALIELKQAGVSEKVIQRMIAGTSGSSTADSAPAAAPASAAASAASPKVAAFYQEFPSITPPEIEPATGRDYFTRFTLRAEKNEHSTTNYARGAIVPINTPVKLLTMSGNRLTLKRLDTGEEIKVENEPKFTKRSIVEMAKIMLSEEKTPLERLPKEVAAAIRNGEMRKGMTRELVIMARGYPPAHETSSIDSDRWVYWSSRFVKQTILFSDGRLAEGRGLY